MNPTRRTLLLAGAVLPWLAPNKAHARAEAHADLRRRLTRIHQDAASHAERVSAVSSLFIGKRYAASPLGEGPDGDRDTDPIADFERFDCVTFVEEVMALAWWGELDEAITKLQNIRYQGGTIHYGQRKHITMAQWIPLNVRAGFLVDCTQLVAPADVRVARLVLTPKHFKSQRGRALRLLEHEQPLGDFRVPVQPLSALQRYPQRIGHGTVITTIRADRKHVPYRASHMGLVVVKKGRRFVRHAHQPSGHVVEHSLARFLANARAANGWPLTGFNLQRISAYIP